MDMHFLAPSSVNIQCSVIKSVADTDVGLYKQRFSCMGAIKTYQVDKSHGNSVANITLMSTVRPAAN